MISVNSNPHRQMLLLRDDHPLPAWKRTIDILCSLAALPFLAVTASLVALWLALTSPGPVLFKQERVGYNGRRFMLYKFRTMHADAEVASHRAYFTDLVRANRPMQKLDATRDARVIPGGWLLRASGLDELPQILNVFRGEMSLVGPRPCIPYEYEQYSAWHRRRLGSVPGLTGLWQVSGKNRTTFDEMVRLDVEYSQTKSLYLDLLIVAKTLPALWVQIIDTHLLRRSRQTAARATIASDKTAATFQTPAMPIPR